MINLEPMPGYVLVELAEEFAGVYVPDKKYDTKTSGVVIDAANDAFIKLKGKTVYFEEYKDGTQVKADDKIYAFIKTEDIRGYAG